MHNVLRKVGSKALRTYGQGVARMEKVLLDVLQDLIEDINKTAGQPVVINDVCLSYVSCIMYCLVSVYRGDYDYCRVPGMRQLSPLEIGEDNSKFEPNKIRKIQIF